jgi:hypothetical protein
VPTNEATPQSYTGPAFEHDIFVSYSHGIPPQNGGDSDLKTWTHALVNKLKEHVGYSLENQRHPIDVWYDAKLRGNVALTDTLKREVEKSSMLLIIMTGHYLTSDWCKKEREWFEQEIRRRGCGDIENVFVVRAMATESQDWPSFLKDGLGKTVLGYPFCDEAKGRDSRPFGWINPDDSNTGREFLDSLTKLSSDMATRLDEIRKEENITPSTADEFGAQIQPVNNDWCVMVAPGTEDVRPFAKEIRTYLEQRGCRLLPPKETGIEEFTEQDENHALSVARAFVQLIGFSPAKEKKGAEFGRVQLLNRRARDQSIAQFLWRKTSIPLNALDYDPTYKHFVGNLGDIPDHTASELGDRVIAHLRSRESRIGEDQPITAFIEVPGMALREFDRWQNDISAEDCALLPLKAPIPGKINQIQGERKSRQLIYPDCNVVLLLYCIEDQLNWLSGAIVNFNKDITAVRRRKKPVPAPVVVDYIGEAKDLAGTLGVDVVFRDEGSDPNELWRQVRSIAA